MKKLKELIFLFILSLFRLLRKILPEQSFVAVVPPASPGSLGDQALMQGFCELSGKKRLGVLEVSMYPPGIPHKTIEVSKSLYFLKQFSKRDYIILAFKVLRYKQFSIIGADTFDGSYSLSKNLIWLDICDVLAHIGIPLAVISFSFSNNPNEQLVERIKNSSTNITFKSRDPVSASRFSEFTGRKVKTVADLAFSMRAGEGCYPNLESVSHWIDQQFGSLIMIVNIHHMYMIDDWRLIAVNFSNALNRIFSKRSELRVVLLPHDMRDAQSDEIILTTIQEMINLDFQHRIILARGFFDSWEAKNIVKKADLVVTGRMHLAIAALSQCIPCYCLSYKGKFEGLMQHFLLDRNILDGERVIYGYEVEDFINYALESFSNLRIEIEKSILKVEKLSALNLD